MAEYRAKPGQEDRDGEMTGAITVNMILVMVPLVFWCVLIGPIWFDVRTTLLIGIGLGIALSIVGVPISRRLWARFSAWSDRI